jgi:phosphoribosyl 1,2-cyclic phosphate phosphodiesterase
MVTTETGANIVVDTPPEMRIALLQNNVRRMDAILFTHSHADHIFGMDDVRVFNYRQQVPMPVYAEASVLADLRRIYEYVFVTTQRGGGKPQVELREVEPMVALELGGLDVLPLRVFHGKLPVLAYKFGRSFAYVTDVSRIPEDTWSELEDLDVLMLDAVRREAHETHFNLEQALEVIEKLKPQSALLTHLSHDYDYEETNKELPPNVRLAYDNLVFQV